MDHQVAVVSSLPRDLAVRVLKKTQLSAVFEGRVPPDHLVCRDEIPRETTGDDLISEEDFSTRRIMRCCGRMRSPTALSVCVDGNRREILAAKRAGLGVVGVQGQ